VNVGCFVWSCGGVEFSGFEAGGQIRGSWACCRACPDGKAPAWWDLNPRLLYFHLAFLNIHLQYPGSFPSFTKGSLLPINLLHFKVYNIAGAQHV
jgi:hypothetical protein